MTETKSNDFIRAIINEDLRTNKHGGKVVTRFPPEPNGFLHIGHAKSICLNFGLAKEYQGTCHLRFDDTDPVKEDTFFEDSIKEMVQWLGFDWGENLYHASDYFDTLYELALKLIKAGKAYVCSQSLEEMREYRGTVTEAGRSSPYRNRSVEENLDLFSRMKAGEYKDGEHVLRAKIDMASPNMKMRDPLLYRIRHVSHHMTGDKWCIYPLYDFTHCLSDSIEGITHSICTLEFENNRELYDWIINELDMPEKPKQYEFARLNINATVMSKRKIQALVEGGYVVGWDDPRLHTLAGLRRRGYTPESIRNFCASVGIAKANSVVDMAQLEFAIRDDLNFKAPRVLAVLDPLKVTIKNYPEEKVEEINASYYPEDVPKEGTRVLPFSREIYIEKSDFMEKPSKGFFRLSPGQEVRLRHAYIIRCEDVVRDEKGDICELLCVYDEATAIGSNPSDGRRIKGTIQWVSVAHALKAEVRSYDRLFAVENPSDAFIEELNPQSLKQYPEAVVEPSLAGSEKEKHFQFERHGYFVTDREESTPSKLVFNKTVALKDSWSKKPPVVKVDRKAKKEVKQGPETKPEYAPEVLQKAHTLEVAHAIAQDYALILALNEDLLQFFEQAVAVYSNAKGIANWVLNDIQRVLKESENIRITPAQIAQLVKFLDDELISSKIAKDVFALMLESGDAPEKIIEEKNLRQLSSEEEIVPLVQSILKENPEVVEQIKAGRDKRIGFLLGLCMKASGGRANPRVLNQIVMNELDKI